jgi:hypothetical protein
MLFVLLARFGWSQKNSQAPVLPSVTIDKSKVPNYDSRTPIRINDTTNSNILNCVANVQVISPGNNVVLHNDLEGKSQLNITVNLKNFSETDSLIIKLGKRAGMRNVKNFKVKYINSKGVQPFNDKVSSYQIVNGTAMLTLIVSNIEIDPQAYLTIGTKRKNGTISTEYVTVIQKNGK